MTLRPTRSTRATLKPKNVFNDDSFQNPDFVNPEYGDSRAAGSDESDYYHYYDYDEEYSTTVEPSLGPDLKSPRPQLLQKTLQFRLIIFKNLSPKILKIPIRPVRQFIRNTRWRIVYSYSRILLRWAW